MSIFNKSLTVVAAIGLAFSALAQSTKRPAELMVGDNAPSISVAKWVKGNPVDSLNKGNIYVVEFWATWCGPCKVSIPHLTELQKKFGEKATFIGVSSFENNWAGVEPFVKSEGDQMDYNVAMDKIDKPTDREGDMAKNWMIAAHQNGIPTAFVIDKEGKVAWIGHPMELEGPLGKVIDGTWDRETFAKQYATQMQQADAQQQAAANSPMAKLAKQYRNAMTSKDYPAALKTLDEIEKVEPKMADQAQMMRYDIYLKSGDENKATALANKLVDGSLKNNAMGLNQIAWGIVDPKSTMKHKDFKLAKKAAERAVEVSKRQAEMLDTLAWTYHAMGDNKKALELENEALAKAQGDKTDYQNALKTFQNS